MNKPVVLPKIRNITISGRIAGGSSTLATSVSDILHWKKLNGGELFRKFTKEQGFSIVNTESRPDQFDLDYEEKIKKLLREDSHNVIESHLSGFDAQGIDGVFKILVSCEDETGEDKTDIRIDRLVNRDSSTVEEAKHEILERERQNLVKWRRLYAQNNPEWIYWDKNYYDLCINTYSHNPEESLVLVCEAIGFTK
jgi:cytidylate kinase